MELVIEFAKLLIPAAIVLYAMYLVVKSFLDKELTKQSMEIRGKSIETVLPNRLHAYERVCLFLERITLNSLILRLNNGKYTAREFQQIMINEIREEYNHNVSQQLYMSDEVWEMVKNAKEGLITMINEAMSELKPEANNLDLAKQLFEKSVSQNDDKIQAALLALKNEIRQVF
ncbi:hypothetical protein LVD15_12820 [Fulvivirga maritima]|uniref:DUF7935 family protein n=1 Tax=Fulvivirga maritima TaxID=2904247 RepID=UPI001F2F0401|nr:hypothetical protein [Fulvivirga maritima]UII29268.1 hypothetical protein LVD15_12820 [Fulvivirga maritima]